MTDVQFSRYQYFYESAFSVFGEHLGAFVNDMIERDHATSTVTLYLSCINDVAKAMEAAALSACSLDESSALHLIAAMGWIQSRETYGNFMMKRFVGLLAERGIGKERPTLSPKAMARSELRKAYEDYLRRQRGANDPKQSGAPLLSKLYIGLRCSVFLVEPERTTFSVVGSV